MDMHEAPRGTFADQQMKIQRAAGCGLSCATAPDSLPAPTLSCGLQDSAIPLSPHGCPYQDRPFGSQLRPARRESGASRAANHADCGYRLASVGSCGLRQPAPRKDRKRARLALKMRQPCYCSAVRTDLYQLRKTYSMPPDTIALAPTARQTPTPLSPGIRAAEAGIPAHRP